MKIKKEEQVDILTKYLKEYNYIIKTESIFSSRLSIQSPKPNENLSLYYVEDYVDSTVDKILKLEKFFDFISYCYKNNKPEIGFQQLVKKTPKNNSYEYEDYVEKVITYLSVNSKEEVFKFLNRPKFLERSYTSIVQAHNDLTQKQRVELIEKMFLTKTFNNVETQKFLFNYVKNNIDPNSELLKEFYKIQEVKNSDSIVDNISQYSTLVFNLNSEKIAGISLDSKFDVDTVFNNILKNVMSLKENKQNEYGIVDILFKKENNTNNHSIVLLANNENLGLNKILIEKLVNKTANIKNYLEFSDFRKNFDSFLKEVETEYFYNNLKNDLNNNKKEETKRLKI